MYQIEIRDKIYEIRVWVRYAVPTRRFPHSRENGNPEPGLKAAIWIPDQVGDGEFVMRERARGTVPLRDFRKDRVRRW